MRRVKICSTEKLHRVYTKTGSLAPDIAHAKCNLDKVFARALKDPAAQNPVFRSG